MRCVYNHLWLLVPYPFLAIRTLLENAVIYKVQFQQVTDALVLDTYKGDIGIGANSTILFEKKAAKYNKLIAIIKMINIFFSNKN